MKIRINDEDLDIDLDLGDDHYLQWYQNQAGERAGAIIWNKASNTETGWCGGSIAIQNAAGSVPHPFWTVTSGTLAAGDFTLVPSILCRACGDHGFIREGKWVRA